MDMILPYLVSAVGGAIGGNILGVLTRGGGGVVGRSLIGAIGGAGLAFAASPEGANFAAVADIAKMWGADKLGGLGLADNAKHLSSLITGAAGGGVLGLIGGLLLRPRA
ncbi:MAG: hypothetical protein ABL883_08995 [Terricaulis sp.]